MEDKILERRKKLLATLIFLIKLNLLVIPIYVLLYLDFSVPQIQFFLASSISSTLSLFKFPVISEEKNVYVFLAESESYKIIPFEISMDCTGWKSMYLLFALVFASSFDLKRNFKFLAIYLPILFIINFLRITSTIAIALTLGFEYFEVTHNILWREGMIFFVILIWFIWLRKIKYKLKDNLNLVERLVRTF
ncbi:MAG: exosortase/archaeosortase family protein [Candidatus Aenigmatarchaeota archaeon]